MSFSFRIFRVALLFICQGSFTFCLLVSCATACSSFRIFRVALLFICQGSSFSFLLSFSSLFILPQPLSLVNYFFYLFFRCQQVFAFAFLPPVLATCFIVSHQNIVVNYFFPFFYFYIKSLLQPLSLRY